EVQNGNDAGDGSLRDLLEDLSPGATVKIPASIGRIALDSAMTIARGGTIEGAGAGNSVLDAQGKSRAIHIIEGANVTISGTRITGGKVALKEGAARGGAIFLDSGSLTLEGSRLDGDEVETA